MIPRRTLGLAGAALLAAPRIGNAQRARPLRFVPFAELFAMIGDGRLTDNETIAAVLLAAIRLGRVR